MIKKIIFVINIYLLQNIMVISCLNAKQEYYELDSIVAIVEQETISKSDLFNSIEEKKNTSEREGLFLPNEKILIKESLEELINQSLILQYASNIGVIISEKQLEGVIQNIAKDNNLSYDDLKKNIEESGQSFQRFKKNIKFELTLNQVKRRAITANLNVSEFEIDNYITLEEKTTPDKFNLAHILIEVSEGKNDLDKKLNLVLEALKIKSFDKVAIEYSDGLLGLSGGNFGWKRLDELPDSFIEITKRLKVGQTSSPFKTENGYHLIKLLDKKGVQYESILINQLKVRHILIKHNEIISEGDVQKKLNHIRNQIEQGLKFSEAAKKYSDDTTAANGGDLGWLNPGNNTNEFEKTVNNMELNKISKPFKTSLGWHLIEVTDERIEDLTEKSKRQSIKNKLLQQKTNIQFYDWIKSLKGRSYIEIRLYE